MLRWLWLSLVVVIFDQVSKQLVESNFLVFEVEPVLPYLNLTLVYNEGAAFSFLSDQDGWQRWFFILIGLMVSLVLIIWISRLAANQRLGAVALSLVVGGALGNILDRLFFGHVVDFIDLYYGDWHWPAFNVADSAITLGVILMLVQTVREEYRGRAM
ncbi:MAG: lipoprotein signal peptidase [Gammaproteobacteria bacterium]|nr:lipoprotein signal peptidase [Gammaproteobacteria bacterium]MCP5407117.1 lipoprotein signal peptidase [Chromatiaceae bacterium]MCP5408325.1 lipoprotein signal peptidase [Chromatiaceae bacterium]MCP5442139.1 lipoprotein signal peptidase [Chromatiaceae bacterium]